MVGAGYATDVDAVENPAVGLRVTGERCLAGDHVRLDVISCRICGGDELVGAAIEQPGGAGLLSYVRVRACSAVRGRREAS